MITYVVPNTRTEKQERAEMAKDVAQLIKEATEAVKDVPDALKTVAFEKAFDALQAEQQGGSGNQSANSRGRRQSMPKGTRASTSQAAGESNRSLLDQLDRTSHPEITHDGTALTKSLRVLRAAHDDLGIDGLSASDIAHVLTDKYRCKITRQAVSMALNGANQLANRHKDGNAVIFRIMSRGERHLDDLDAGTDADSKPTKNATGKKTRGTKKKSSTKSSHGAAKKGASKKSPGAMAAIKELYDAGFFSQPQSIAAIIEHLKHSAGRTYKPNEMSPPLLRNLRSHKLIRAKNADHQYEYKNA